MIIQTVQMKLFKPFTDTLNYTFNVWISGFILAPLLIFVYDTLEENGDFRLWLIIASAITFILSLPLMYVFNLLVEFTYKTYLPWLVRKVFISIAYLLCFSVVLYFIYALPYNIFSDVSFLIDTGAFVYPMVGLIAVWVFQLELNLKEVED